ncbi:MAG: hypothetical protein M1336_04640 [Deltaproteobacteria bacterium]|nr:hypothetical protein [Deltaproteobacteria bacterium]
MRDELGAEFEERDLVKHPLTVAELAALFGNRDPLDYLNPKSQAFKARGLAGRTLTRDQVLDLMAEEPALIKRPLLVVGRQLIAGFDRKRMREALTA